MPSCYVDMQQYEPYMQVYQYEPFYKVPSEAHADRSETEPLYRVSSEAHAGKSETVLNRYRYAEVEATHEGSVLQSICVKRLSESFWSQHKRQAFVARSLLRDRSKGESEVMPYSDECSEDSLQYNTYSFVYSLYCLLYCLATTVSCQLRQETATRARCSRPPRSVAHVHGGV